MKDQTNRGGQNRIVKRASKASNKKRSLERVDSTKNLHKHENLERKKSKEAYEEKRPSKRA